MIPNRACKKELICSIAHLILCGLFSACKCECVALQFKKYSNLLGKKMTFLPKPARALRIVGGLAMLGACTFAWADPEALLLLKNHRFEPTEIKVPAGQRIRLTVHNQDTTPEEFESYKMNREKVIPAGAKVVIFIGPLKPGLYEFLGEYNQSTAKGVLVAE